MNHHPRLSRRAFLMRSAGGAGLAAAGWHFSAPRLSAEEAAADWSAAIRRIADAEVRAGVEAAIVKNVLPPATEIYYPGHFNITADGQDYGGDSAWPGLDSWQLAGAYLLLGRTRLVCDYFDFVRASHARTATCRLRSFPRCGRPPPTCAA